MNIIGHSASILSLSASLTMTAIADESLELENFFNANLNTQMQLCGVCHIPNGLADIEDGNAFLLYSDQTHYQSFYDAWVALGEGVSDNRLLTMNSDPALNHTGLQNWPTTSSHYRNAEKLLKCWDQPSQCEIIPPTDSADLAVSMSGNNGKNNNGVIQYSISVSNSGPNTADTLEIVHTLPTQVSLDNVSPDSIAYTIAGRDITFYIESLNVGSTEGIGVTVNTAVNNNTLMNFTSSVDSITEDVNQSNNTSTAYFGGGVVANNADLSVSMAGNNGKNQDGLINYTITIKNAGPNTADAIEVTHRLPTPVTLRSVSPSSIAYTTEGKLVRFHLDSLASGISRDINVSVSTATDNKDKMDFTASVTSETEDPNSTNNTSTKKFGGSINWLFLVISGLFLCARTSLHKNSNQAG
ncbi:MAG: DUF11 domain-containing protein [Pseudomonadota bacterium]|nr:DUF11 domain-containing protein [Pseudomonadota bacterium]